MLDLLRSGGLQKLRQGKEFVEKGASPRKTARDILFAESLPEKGQWTFTAKTLVAR